MSTVANMEFLKVKTPSLPLYINHSGMRDEHFRLLVRNKNCWHVVFYHDPCQDGFCAATVIREALPKDCYMLQPIRYGSKETDTIKETLYDVWYRTTKVVPYLTIWFVDFCPSDTSFEYLTSMAANSKPAGYAFDVVVLDHHKSALNRMERVAKKPHMYPWFHAIFDMTRSGAGITWDTFFGEQMAGHRPALVTRVEDRDLWKFHYDDTKAVHQALRLEGYVFDKWKYYLRNDTAVERDLVKIGIPILQYFDMVLQSILMDSHKIMLIGPGQVWNNIPAVNASYEFASEAGNFLAIESPFAVVYRRAGGFWNYSLRSAKGMSDVQEIATMFGGGGHVNAAGFESKQAVHTYI